MKITINKTIIFEGIFLSDLESIEDIFESRIEEESTYGGEENMGTELMNEYMYDRSIPEKFTTMEDWPQKVRIHCWYCGLRIDHIPAFLPLNINKDGSCDVEGMFYSWDCVLSYIAEKYHDEEKQIELRSNVFMMYERIHGRACDFYNMKNAPSKYIMIKFCGAKKGISEKDYIDKLRYPIIKQNL